MEINNICKGCFQGGYIAAKSNCPVCGFDEQQYRNECVPDVLPLDTILNNRYFVGKYLNRDHSGINYVGWDSQKNRKVVIREYYPEGLVNRNIVGHPADYCVQMTYEDEKYHFRSAVQTYIKGGFALKSLRLPGTAEVYDCFTENGTGYIIRDVVWGMTIREYVKKEGKLSEEKATELIHRIIVTLNNMHQNGFFHLNISPDNVLIASYGGAVLTGFNYTDYRGFMIGNIAKREGITPGYTAPEQRDGEKQGAWTDVYSLCAVMFMMLTGRAPLDVVIRKQNDDKYLHVLQQSLINHHITEHTCQVLIKGMDLNPDNRYHSMKELENDLYTDYRLSKVRLYENRIPHQLTKAEQSKKTRIEYIWFILPIIVHSFFSTYNVSRQESMLEEKMPVKEVYESVYLEPEELTENQSEKLKTDYSKLIRKEYEVRNQRESDEETEESKKGDAFYYGEGAEADYVQAFEWYQKGAALGHPGCICHLAEMYWWGYGVKQNYEKSIELLQKAADVGVPMAMLDLGNCYYYGNGVGQDYEKAVELYQDSIDAGGVLAMSVLGELYSTGNGVEQDHEKALELYTMAVECGEREAMWSLGFAYYKGQGVEKNYAKAAELYLKSAYTGAPVGMYLTGVSYYYGYGFKQDYEKAYEWFQKGADEGNSSCEMMMGFMYLKGNGVEKDEGKAKALLKKAADAGEERAQKILEGLS